VTAVERALSIPHATFDRNYRLYDLFGVFAAADCPGPLHGGSLAVGALAELVD
jgi:hypothetical protein